MTSIELVNVISVVGLFAGPIFAVIVGRIMEDARAQRARRMDVYRTLMRTRRAQMGVDHVGALNLVEVEFAGCSEVTIAFRGLMTLLNELPSRHPEEVIDGGNSPEDRVKRDESYWQSWQRTIPPACEIIARNRQNARLQF